jgi:hypothetical protein
MERLFTGKCASTEGIQTRYVDVVMEHEVDVEQGHCR